MVSARLIDIYTIAMASLEWRLLATRIRMIPKTNVANPSGPITKPMIEHGLAVRHGDSVLHAPRTLVTFCGVYEDSGRVEGGIEDHVKGLSARIVVRPCGVP
jgi:hypothetical protein